ncbi:hypothetical protein RW1_051_00280 [Rhodococcus wratislaviensis NBRC 100605]|uniref:Uncharacterized protein n=1 Tax=Rhodococcus wratislaviensis NBRC 100605 TaxID=1219028 RepID=X0PXN2_RHOWR|nr:hypothetical protein [Rhodococcus wratislaviensis]GAF48264.1 hypothetical protein RW1_051_00280 [Rhodococcus wratislaviensis NBRC 100605]
MSEYDGKQFVGIDLHRQRSVIVRQTDSGEQLAVARIVNDPASLALQLEKAGEHPEVVLEATMAGTGRSTRCREPVPRCTLHILWVSRDSSTGG